VGGVERLEHVVAGCGEEARLRKIGEFRALLGADQIEVGLFQASEGPTQLVGVLSHPPFEVDRGLEQRERVALLVHRPLDAADQRRIDPLQPVYVVDIVDGHLSTRPPACGRRRCR
jgi:hypothetical protein